MANFLKALSVLGSLLPALLSFMTTLEGSGASGAEKKNAALAFVQALLTGAAGWVKELDDAMIQTVMGIVGHVIDAAVAAYNAIGLFKHKA